MAKAKTKQKGRLSPGVSQRLRKEAAHYHLTSEQFIRLCLRLSELMRQGLGNQTVDLSTLMPFLDSPLLSMMMRPLLQSFLENDSSTENDPSTPEKNSEHPWTQQNPQSGAPGATNGQPYSQRPLPPMYSPEAHLYPYPFPEMPQPGGWPHPQPTQPFPLQQPQQHPHPLAGQTGLFFP
ncbi:hypothetical protein [Alicyclobacillus tolerans]|uniref:Uncharacterized protein n=2 Tax=Alicyclobacillus tolerans TaxID=90970 RepID=A0ABT9LVU1_9BACL|nr:MULTISPECIES: hypothetical protein [Alicyclobacillus]MDP9728374.1 hypothetical protein [Alicyclobacillus tengchongensis]SHK14046.1 hypothetical protein SAMN05443507_10927 [Alicyclobacillus montanus]